MNIPLDSDGHVHTIYSGHSGPEMFIPAVMARCAEASLRRVVILEHAPALSPEVYLHPRRWFRSRNDRTVLEAILAEIAPRRRFHSGTRFLAGAEVDADPVKLDGSLMLEDLAGADLVLAATHLLPGGHEFWFDRPAIADEDKPELLGRWLDWIEKVVRHRAVDVLAHPGCELAACGLTGDFGPEFRRSFAPALEAMAAGPTAFELNEAAITRLTPEELAGYAELVALARECGVRFTIGSDAHRAAQVGVFRLVPELAGVAGLTEKDLLEF